MLGLFIFCSISNLDKTKKKKKSPSKNMIISMSRLMTWHCISYSLCNNLFSLLKWMDWICTQWKRQRHSIMCPTFLFSPRLLPFSALDGMTRRKLNCACFISLLTFCYYFSHFFSVYQKCFWIISEKKEKKKTFSEKSLRFETVRKIFLIYEMQINRFSTCGQKANGIRQCRALFSNCELISFIFTKNLNFFEQIEKSLILLHGIVSWCLLFIQLSIRG